MIRLLTLKGVSPYPDTDPEGWSQAKGCGIQGANLAGVHHHITSKSGLTPQLSI